MAIPAASAAQALRQNGFRSSGIYCGGKDTPSPFWRHANYELLYDSANSCFAIRRPCARLEP